MKQLIWTIRNLLEDIFGFLFALVAAPIIRLSGRSDMPPESSQKSRKKEGN